MQAPILDSTILAWDFSLVIGGECAIFLPFCFHPIRPVEYPNIVITLVKPLFYNIYSKREKRAPALRKQNKYPPAKPGVSLSKKSSESWAFSHV